MPFLRNEPKNFNVKVAIRSLFEVMKKSSINEKQEHKSEKSDKYKKIKSEKDNNPFIYEEFPSLPDIKEEKNIAF